MDEDEDKYIFKTNVNNSLSKIIGKQYHEEKCDWEPPLEYGLNNCNKIIKPGINYDSKKIFNINYLQTIKMDLLNGQKLNKYQMEYLKNLKKKDKDEILDLYNNYTSSITEIIELDNDDKI